MMKRISGLFVAVILLISLCACMQSTEEQWQEQYDLGARYLSEGNYEEAIIAFTAAIEIDPKRAETYIQLAEIYRAAGDLTQAFDILHAGFTETADNSTGALIHNFISKNTSLLLDDKVVPSVADFKINSVSIVESTIEDFEIAYPSAAEENWYYEPIRTYEQGDETGIQHSPRVHLFDNGFTDWGVTVWSESLTSRIQRATFIMGTHQPEIHFNDIQLGDQFENVLEILGFRNQGLAFIRNLGMPYISIGIADEADLFFTDIPQHYQESGITEINIHDERAGGWLILQFSEGVLSFVQFNSLS